jgi:hypothetical protein
MVYDLSCDHMHVIITMALRPNLDGLGEWMAEACASDSPAKPSVTERGPSREGALRAVAGTWAAKDSSHGLPVLNWDEIANALRTVRAI